MSALYSLSRTIDAINSAIGRWVSWLILVAVLVSAANAIMRKAFDMSSNAWLELQWYLFGAAFMLAAAYTLQRNEHVRIDIVTHNLSKRTREWIDLFGHVFFLSPFVLLMAYLTWPFFFASFQSGEMSSNAGGLILWPAKALIFAGFASLCAQAISEIIKRVMVLHGDIADETPEHALPPAIEDMEDAETLHRRPRDKDEAGR